MKTKNMIAVMMDCAEDLRNVQELMSLLNFYLQKEFIYDKKCPFDPSDETNLGLDRVNRFVAAAEVGTERLLDIAKTLEDAAAEANGPQPTEQHYEE